ncbi:hypothetical protein [Streptomyces sp. NBC_00347]|uniref:hypothetical protein n=2 Tax=unclassified Streptomyces TaxID=2593676 RepID=UPI0022516B3A|nr:hypothetical protein [Streptomyces sp. NBC_00347]MCX5124320.1 hypothetical protein [Streptomyces sp. NBC_00347]
MDVHRGWTTGGVGKVDTLWALVWHFDADGKVDRVTNLSGDQHQMDSYVWANYDLAPIPDRLARGQRGKLPVSSATAKGSGSRNASPKATRTACL